jgi:hypothetical protein
LKLSPRSWVLPAGVALAVAVVLQTSSAHAAPAPAAGGSVTVKRIAGNGFVPSRPLTLSSAQLAGLQQATVTVTIGGAKEVEKGPPVSELLYTAKFSGVANCKDDELRY